jgi:hypothetical protein
MTYLVDRKYDFVRVPVRFLQYIPAEGRKQTGGFKFGPPHSLTLLDGEMVVDEDLAAGVN